MFTGIPILTPIFGSKAVIVVDFAGLSGDLVILRITLVLLSFAQRRRDALDGATLAAILLPAAREALLQPVVVSPGLAIAFVLTGAHFAEVIFKPYAARQQRR